ncbi:hypothetical protein BC941DRAFT_470290 [Chlamydoabsidia padenii]|nr:hypothetical protein BC941DRAFT_470290 [Chlamydoabsidia padenii]
MAPTMIALTGYVPTATLAFKNRSLNGCPCGQNAPLGSRKEMVKVTTTLAHFLNLSEYINIQDYCIGDMITQVYGQWQYQLQSSS